MAPWLIWTFVALASWGVWAVISKLLGDALTAGQSQVLSTLGTLPVVVSLAMSRHASLAGASRRGLLIAFLGGLVTCVGNVAYYGALARGEKVVTAVSLTALYPLVTVLLAMVLLRERLNRVQMAGIGLSMAAIWFLNIQSDGGFVSRSVVYAILPVVFWGLSGFLQKLATNFISAAAAALVYLAAFFPVGIVLSVGESFPETMSSRTWGLVLALGFFLGYGNYAIVAAFARGGKAAVIAPLGSLYPIVSVPIAVLFLGESVAPRELLGIACALASVAALSFETGLSQSNTMKSV